MRRHERGGGRRESQVDLAPVFPAHLVNGGVVVEPHRCAVALGADGVGRLPAGLLHQVAEPQLRLPRFRLVHEHDGLADGACGPGGQLRPFPLEQVEVLLHFPLLLTER